MPGEQPTDVQKVLAAVRALAPHATWKAVQDKSGLPEHVVVSALAALRASGLVVAIHPPDEQAGDVPSTTANETS